VLAARTLRDPKERIATLLVAPFMNCGAKLPVFAMIIAAFFPGSQATMMFIFTLLSWFFALFAAKLIRATVLRGPKTPFVMELPPYRAPTIKGMAIHTWERTWQYIKKAGTVILGVSILVWAAMSFPGLDDERAGYYDKTREGLKTELLSSPETNRHVINERLITLEKEKQAETLKGTVAGRLGVAMEFFTSKIGFDYRTNIALLGGFAAKEVIVSTLGTAYSLGAEESGTNSLPERLRQDPAWNPLAAFTFVLFTMLYIPCLVTIVSIARETSWSWAAFSMVFNLVTAYTISFIVYQSGSALGIGV
jgi:ferrous iron transport protein B